MRNGWKIGLFTVVIGVALAQSASALTTVYSFCALADCADGAHPQAQLVYSVSGVIYGTTLVGGSAQKGTIFSLTPENGNWTLKTLHSFCQQKNCKDGAAPVGVVAIDKLGNVYGVASQGGAGGGLVYRLAPDGGFKSLYQFCAADGCADGVGPLSGLTYTMQNLGEPYDGTSPLYSTTDRGGAFDKGTVFSLTPPKAGKPKWHHQVIYNFCSEAACKDGASPAAAPLMIFGQYPNMVDSTSAGGRKGDGAFFTLSPAHGNRWHEKVEHHFCTFHGCADGGAPNSTSTTERGGNTQCGGQGCGIAYQLTYGGFENMFVIAHTFCSEANCIDGSHPVGGMNSDLFGVTLDGGAGGGGTLFANLVFPAYSFCSLANCADGANPASAPIRVDINGGQMGTTQNGGANGAGTIYFVPGPQ